MLVENGIAGFSGLLNGDGSVRKQGEGVLLLRLPTEVDVALDSGSLVMNGGVGLITVAPGTRLADTGTVRGDLVNRGTLSPGFSPGVIVVEGNDTHTQASVLLAEIANAADFDRVIVSGTFDTFTAPTGRVTLVSSIGYDANRVIVTSTAIPFVAFAGTPNQEAIAAAAQQNPALTTALNGVASAADFPAAFNALSPQVYSIWSDLAFACGLTLGALFTAWFRSPRLAVSSSAAGTRKDLPRAGPA